jgi:hypothetical protein
MPRDPVKPSDGTGVHANHHSNQQYALGPIWNAEMDMWSLFDSILTRFAELRAEGGHRRRQRPPPIADFVVGRPAAVAAVGTRWHHTAPVGHQPCRAHTFGWWSMSWLWSLAPVSRRPLAALPAVRMRSFLRGSQAQRARSTHDCTHSCGHVAVPARRWGGTSVAFGRQGVVKHVGAPILQRAGRAAARAAPRRRRPQRVRRVDGALRGTEHQPQRVLGARRRRDGARIPVRVCYQGTSC